MRHWYTQYRWVVWLFLCALAIHWTETIYRLGEARYVIPYFGGYVFPHIDTYFSIEAHLWLQPAYFLAGITGFYGFRKEEHYNNTFLMCWATFIFFIAVSRVVVTIFHAKEAFNVDVLAGVLLMVYGLYLTALKVKLSFEKPFLAIVGISSLLLFWAYVRLLEHGDFLSETFSDFRLDWWMLSLFVSAVLIAVWEYHSRLAKFKQYSPVSFHRDAPHVRFVSKRKDSMWLTFIPLTFFLNGGLFYGYRYAVPSFMFAWALYSVFDVLIRIVNVRLLGEHIHVPHLIGMFLIVIGTFLTYIGGV